MRGSRPGERRGGRQKGTPNRTTKALKDMILDALDHAGGVGYLKKQADQNPTAFMALVGKLVPRDIKAEHSGSVAMLADRLEALRAQRERQVPETDPG